MSIPSLNVDNNIISGDIEKAEAFNRYFVQCSTLDDSQALLPSDYPLLTQNTLEELTTRVSDVEKCILQLDTSKAFGPDGSSPKLLKETANQLSASLCKFFNTSLHVPHYILVVFHQCGKELTSFLYIRRMINHASQTTDQYHFAAL